MPTTASVFRFTIIMTAFVNTGYIPLAVVSSFCRKEDNLFGTDCSANGVAYVSFSQWASVILAYTLVYHMMEQPLEHYEILEEKEEEDVVEEISGIIQEEPVDNRLSRPLLVEADWPGLEDKETELCKTPFIARLFNSISHTNIPDDLDSMAKENPNSPKSIKCLAEPKMVKKMRIVAVNTPLRHILQPPVFASVLGILVGIIPGLKSIAFTSDSPLDVLTNSLDIISEATVPSIMLVIGGMLLEGPNESKLGTRTTVGIIVARLLVLPLIGIGVLYLADKWHCLIQDDQLYRFVLFLQYTTPSAILLAAMARLRGYAVGEASALLFWQHVFAMFSLALHIFIYIKLFSKSFS
ncbi:Auxin efflux carrier family protein [Melia azedarach]|uniref:Auxin efflux carrier family protein n=1 Tax=Melia azedarach TaxID=155640 RepID=A0ACC1X6B2_MELAZ|nr:Auxin efflux carrier family protein [Melia azedarach]